MIDETAGSRGHACTAARSCRAHTAPMQQHERLRTSSKGGGGGGPAGLLPALPALRGEPKKSSIEAAAQTGHQTRGSRAAGGGRREKERRRRRAAAAGDGRRRRRLQQASTAGGRQNALQLMVSSDHTGWGHARGLMRAKGFCTGRWRPANQCPAATLFSPGGAERAHAAIPLAGAVPSVRHPLLRREPSLPIGAALM